MRSPPPPHAHESSASARTAWPIHRHGCNTNGEQQTGGRWLIANECIRSADAFNGVIEILTKESRPVYFPSVLGGRNSHQRLMPPHNGGGGMVNHG